MSSLFLQAAANIRRWRENPKIFVHEELGVEEIDHFQVEFLDALGSDDPLDSRIAQKASKGPGKTTGLAWAGLWALATQSDTGDHLNGFAISVTADNLRDNLWKELAKWRDRSEFLKAAFEISQTRIWAREYPQTWWLAARNWPKGGNAQEQSDALAGLHSGYVIILMDESGSIPTAVSATAEAALSSVKWGKFCQAGNPTTLDGALADACIKQRRFWRVITINGDPDNPKRASRVNIEWARRQIEMYGRENPWVLVNVLGEFPPSSLNTLLGVEDVEKAFTRYGAIKANEYNHAQKRIGCDVHRFGDDRDVFFPRQGIMALKPVIMRNERGPNMAARIALMIKRWGGNIQCFVDSTGGYGATLEDSLHLAHIPYIPVDFGSKAIDPRFENRRAEIWWNMAEWVKTYGAIPPELSEILPELTSVQYTHTKRGRFIMEPKDAVKERLGYSPDLADALATTFAIPDMPDFSSEEGRVLAGAAANNSGLDFEWDPLEDER